MYVIIDTETTGLPTRRVAHYTEHDVWPRIVSVSWALFDTHDYGLKHNYSIVRPDGFVVPEEASKIHGITTEHALAVGRPADEVLNELAWDVCIHRPALVVAHNIAFDFPVLLAEMHRLDLHSAIEKLPTCCTMVAATDYCGIPHGSGDGYKWPKLLELHEKLFGTGFDGQHDASKDVLACARCFLRLRELGLVVPTQFRFPPPTTFSGRDSSLEESSIRIEIKNLLAMIKDFADNHPEFDSQFVESLNAQFEKKGWLSRRQISALRNIVRGWGVVPTAPTSQ